LDDLSPTGLSKIKSNLITLEVNLMLPSPTTDKRDAMFLKDLAG